MALQTSNNDQELVKHLRRRLDALEQERKKGWDPHWKLLAENFMPRRSRFLNEGARTNDGGIVNKLEDDSGIIALRTLASGMQSGLTSPARPWFSLSLQNQALLENNAVRAWLHECYQIMVAVFARSNFYDQIHMLYRELGTFGTAAMFVEEDTESNIRCRTETAGTFCIDVNASYRVDTIYRRLRMTARQILEAWPDTTPERIRLMADQDQSDWITLLHAIEPNPETKPGIKVGTARPWRSIYMLLDHGTEILEHSGYYEFPALCPRWDTTASDVYGSSPAMDALADCRQLQKITEDGRLALEKEVNPPLVAAEGLIDDIDVSPGAINYVSPHSQGQPSVTSLHQVRANFAALREEKNNLERKIREMFFNDLFLMISNAGRQMTATEVAERNAEKMLLLGPVLDRLRSELFQPLIERVWGILNRAGTLPSPPVVAAPKIQGESIKIEFISYLALAQKQAGVSAINQTAGFIGQMAQLSQAALDKLNIDEAIDEIAQMQGVPPNLIRSADEVETLRQEREQQAQAMQQMQMIAQGTDIAATGAQAAKDMGVPQSIQ